MIVSAQKGELLYQGRAFRLEYSSDGFFHFLFKNKAVLNLSDTLEFNDICSELCVRIGETVPAIFHVPSEFGIMEEGRDALRVRLRKQECFRFKAFVTNESESWVFVSLLKELFPSKTAGEVFLNEKDAKVWGLEQLEDQDWKADEVKSRLAFPLTGLD